MTRSNPSFGPSRIRRGNGQEFDTVPQSTSIPAAVNSASISTETLWFNALWFQALWFTAVMGREQLLPLGLGLLALHLVLVKDKRGELLQFACVGGLGMAVDAGLSFAGVYQFADGALVPLWLCCLWLGFAAALGRSLAYFSSKPRLAALAGGVVFPLNYWAGQRLGAVEFGYSLPLTLALIALTWALLFPLLYRLSATLTGSEPEEVA